MNDNWVQGLSDDDRFKVVMNFWAAAADVWPQAFAAPEDHRIQATVGLYSMHMILPILIQMCRDTGDLTKASFARIIEEFDVPADFWSKEDGDPRTLGTGMSSIRALKQYLLNRLHWVVEPLYRTGERPELEIQPLGDARHMTLSHETLKHQHIVGRVAHFTFTVKVASRHGC